MVMMVTLQLRVFHQWFCKAFTKLPPHPDTELGTSHTAANHAETPLTRSVRQGGEEDLSKRVTEQKQGVHESAHGEHHASQGPRRQKYRITLSERGRSKDSSYCVAQKGHPEKVTLEVRSG